MLVILCMAIAWNCAAAYSSPEKMSCWGDAWAFLYETQHPHTVIQSVRPGLFCVKVCVEVLEKFWR